MFVGFIEGHAGSRSLLSQLHQARIDDDSSQPCRYGRFSIEGFDAPVSLEEGLLERVFAIFPVPQNSDCGAQQTLFVSNSEDCKGLVIS
jgi:hypothetical protein